MAEYDARLDQLVAAEGDRLWYDYDFGADWDHVAVAKMLGQPPERIRCARGPDGLSTRGPRQDLGLGGTRLLDARGVRRRAVVAAVHADDEQLTDRIVHLRQPAT